MAKLTKDQEAEIVAFFVEAYMKDQITRDECGALLNAVQAYAGR